MSLTSGDDSFINWIPLSHINCVFLVILVVFFRYKGNENVLLFFSFIFVAVVK